VERAFLEVDDDERWLEQARVVFLTVVGAGLRRGEILGLRWRDVDLADPSGAILRVVRHLFAALRRRRSRKRGRGRSRSAQSSRKSGRRSITSVTQRLFGSNTPAAEGVIVHESKRKGGLHVFVDAVRPFS
jgi:integrase